MNPGAMNHFRMAKAINNLFPVVTPKSFGTTPNGVGLQAQPSYPVMLMPYGNSYMYVQPIAYYPPVYPQPITYSRGFSTQEISQPYPTQKKDRSPFVQSSALSTSPPRTGSITDNTIFNGIKNFGYATRTSKKPKEEKKELTPREILAEKAVKERELKRLQDLTDSHKNIKITDAMTAKDLHTAIMTHFQLFPRVRLSWFNKLLVKVSDKREWYQALEVFDKFHERLIEISPETGTLIIKAACRAGVPEHALALLRDVNRVRMWPTLGGVHYLMINFSLKQDTKAVTETFFAAKKRELKPTMRTYQIIIRECVDNGLVNDAMRFAEESEKEGLVPNRVTYNILMNGLRKANKAQDILTLREKMEKHQLEINDTTIKFTAIAFMMLQDVKNGVTEFLKYPELKEKMEEYCDKFFEVTEENDANQKKCVVQLFDAVVAQGTELPSSTAQRLSELKASLAA